MGSNPTLTAKLLIIDIFSLNLGFRMRPDLIEIVKLAVMVHRATPTGQPDPVLSVIRAAVSLRFG